jgi:formamidopyrimidine-DNA glycosylase
MPELPEVETIKRELFDLLGGTVSAITVSDEMLLGEGTTESLLRSRLIDREFERLDRVGKYLLLQINGDTLLFSLRMTGNLISGDTSKVTSDRVIHFELEQTDLVFSSVRRFSKLHLFETIEFEDIDKLQRLGPDPLRESLGAEELESIYSNRTAPLKTALMNQECLAGLGNIYANEICHIAGIDPRTSIDYLSLDDFDTLSETIVEVLNKAIDLGGSSIRDFSNTSGESGEFQDEFFVYGREGKTCLQCEKTIRKTELAGRSTFWCDYCQPSPV